MIELGIAGVLVAIVLFVFLVAVIEICAPVEQWRDEHDE